MATITKESVFSAADALEARGLRVSVRTVRDHLGGGSPNQITPLVAAWREKKPQVAQADIQLDPRIGLLIAEQVRVAAGESARRADERATEAEDTLQLCQAENGDLAEQLASASTALEDVRAQREQFAGTITALQEDLARTRAEALEEIGAADARAEREREAAKVTSSALARAELLLEGLPELKSKIEQLEKELAEAQASAQVALTEEKDKRVAAEQAAAVGQARLEAAERRTEAAEGEKVELRAELKAVSARLDAAIADAKVAAATAERLEAVERELVSAKAEAGEAKAELKELRVEIRGKSEK